MNPHNNHNSHVVVPESAPTLPVFRINKFAYGEGRDQKNSFLILDQRENRFRHLITLLFLLATTVATADSTITYQGQLQDASGPVDATVDMAFSLFENEVGGSPISGPIPLTDVSVMDGLFQVELDFGGQAYANGLWLAIEVEGESLAPRQAITGAPFAVSTAPGSGSNWEVSGAHIHYLDGRVGIGTSLPNAALQVVGSAIFGDSSNEAGGGNSFVGGGQNNQATGGRGFVAGGAGNVAAGVNSFVSGTGSLTEGRGAHAAGRGAHALHEGSFVWSHWNLAESDFTSTGVNQFLIRAEGGVGIGTNSPGAALDVVGSAKFGGASNQASGTISFAGGGSGNTASGLRSFVGGGRENIASGANSFVARGGNNVAGGEYSFAGGRNAHSEGDGSFLWTDSLDHLFSVNVQNSFMVRATGRVGFFTSVDSNGNPESGTYLNSGGSSWLTYSDRNKKMAISEVDPANVLESLMQMPISEYSYKSQDESIRHMGPMAQDFHPLFGLGEDELMISAMNLVGIALAAIQGLNGELDTAVSRLSELETGKTELAERVAALEAENAELRQLAEHNNELESRLVALEALLGEDQRVAGQAKLENAQP